MAIGLPTMENSLIKYHAETGNDHVGTGALARPVERSSTSPSLVTAMKMESCA
jgi:hypothetical protein